MLSNTTMSYAGLDRRLTAEDVRIVRGSRSNQTIMISVDSTRLGPALGGCRVKTYPSWPDGLADVLRLSAAMTEKAALAGLDHGGGKTVVALDAEDAVRWTSDAGRVDLMADIADAVESLHGAYICGPDIGTGPDDMALLRQRTRHALCRPESAGGSGDSSAPTALGVISSIQAVCGHLWPERDLATLTFAVIGLGHVGGAVANYLAGTGARLTVSDIDPAQRRLADAFAARWVTPDAALTAEVDVVVPCAVGGILTRRSVAELRCRAVVGAANNQLDEDSTADVLHERGIIWAPDTVVSGGGIISAVARELEGVSRHEADDRVRAIGPRLVTVLESAERDDVSPLHVARALVQERLTSARN